LHRTSAVSRAASFAQGDAVDPADEILISRRRSPQAFDKRILERVESHLAIQRHRYHSAVHHRKCLAVERFPPRWRNTHT
jgi:hypothetical protein